MVLTVLFWIWAVVACLLFLIGKVTITPNGNGKAEVRIPLVILMVLIVTIGWPLFVLLALVRRVLR
jgi:hypothetical protein